jgi:hypothetical protein
MFQNTHHECSPQMKYLTTVPTTARSFGKPCGIKAADVSPSPLSRKEGKKARAKGRTTSISTAIEAIDLDHNHDQPNEGHFDAFVVDDPSADRPLSKKACKGYQVGHHVPMMCLVFLTCFITAQSPCRAY